MASASRFAFGDASVDVGARALVPAKSADCDHVELAWRLPPRSSRRRWVLPADSPIGLVPQSAGKECLAGVEPAGRATCVQQASEPWRRLCISWTITYGLTRDKFADWVSCSTPEREGYLKHFDVPDRERLRDASTTSWNGCARGVEAPG